MAKKALKYLRNTVLLLVVLLLVLLVVLRVPAVQTYLAERVTATISKMTGSTLTVDRIAINFIDNVEIKGLYAETPTGDTLANIGSLEVDISIWALISQEVNIDEVRLSNASVALSQNDSGVFNFQYLIDAFASADTTKKDTTPSAWVVSVDRVLLDDVKFGLQMPGIDLNTSVAELDLRMDVLDLTEQRIEVAGLDVTGLYTKLTLASSVDGGSQNDTTSQGPIAYPIPDIGWDFLIADVMIDNSDVDIDLGLSGNSTVAGIDLNDMAIKDLLIDLKQYQWVDDKMSIELNKLSLQETRSGQQIPQLTLSAGIDSKKISIDKLVADIGGSVLNAKAEATYDRFDQLLTFDEALGFDIDIDETNISIAQLRSLVPVMDSLSILQPDLQGSISLKLRSSGTVANIDPSDMVLTIGEHTVADLGFSVKGLPDFNTARFELEMNDISTSYKDITQILVLDSLPKGLSKLGVVHVKGGLSGNLADMDLAKFTINTQSSTSFSATGSVKGLPNIDTTLFALNIQKFTTRAADIEAIAGTTMPPLVKNLGTIAYTGKVSGTMYKPLLKGALTTDIGKLTTDAHAVFDTAYSNASYSGSVQIQQFDLGKLLDNKDLGILSLSVQADGQGLDPKTLGVTLDLNVDQLGYKGYDHKNIVVKGDLDSMMFEGEVHIDDPNLQFDLNGLISLRDGMQQFDLTADLDTIDLQALKLVDIPLRASTHITSNITTYGAATISGKASIMRSIFSDDEDTFVLDSLILTASESTDNGAELSITSPLINVFLKSEPDLTSLPTALLQYLRSISPIIGTDSNKTVSNNSMELLVTVGDITPLTNIVFPSLSRFDTAWVNASFSSSEKSLSLDMQIPEIVMDSLRSGPISLTANGNANELQAQLTIDSTSYTQQIFVPSIQVNASLADRKTNYSLNIYQDSMAVALAMKGTGTLKDTAYVFSLDPDMTLNERPWNIAANNKIAITGTKNRLSISDLTFYRNTRSVAITEKPNKKDSSAMSVTFKNFDLKEISDLVDHQQIDISGVVNGSVKLNDPSNDLDLTSDITINNIKVQESLFGDLSIVAEKVQQKINVNVDLTGSTNDLEVLGAIDLSNNYIDLDVAINRFYMKMLDPFLFAYIDSSEGYISLQSNISGTPDDLSIEGKLGVHDLTTGVVMTGERYSFSDNTITFNNQVIEIPPLQMQDRIDNKLTVQGKINHDHLSDFDLDLAVNTKSFSLLNTTSKNEQPFYGTVILGLDATIKGPPSLPKVIANVSTKKGTAIYVEPLSFESSLADEDYIIFYDPNQLSDTTNIEDIVKPDEYQVQITGVDLVMNFELTPDAKIQIVIDPVAGDTLTTYGQADLTVVVPPTGDPEITGKYTIERGAYKLSYQNLLKKQFEIKPGSSINFTGDPMQGRLDITSIYATRAYTYDLISSEMVSSIDQANGKQEDVNVMLIVKGVIAAPDISFDIQVPGSGFGSMVERKLAQLRQQPSELNKQAFGLLMFDSFIAEESSGDSNFGNAGSNVALRSVSNMLTQQLNRLTSKAKGLSINVTLDSYQSKYAGEDANKNVTEVGVDLKKTFLNDRLEVSMGSNVSLENTSNSTTNEQESYTQVAGHFVLEYKLTENGKYRVKVFNTTDYDALRQSNVNKTGVGISYKESFRKLIDKKKDKDKKKNAPVDDKEAPEPKDEEE